MIDLEENINDSVMMEYINVVKEYNIIQEIKRLQELIKKEQNQKIYHGVKNRFYLFFVDIKFY